MKTAPANPSVLACLAGLAIALSAPAQQQPAQPDRAAPEVINLPAQPQPGAGSVFLDEAVTAPDALTRVREMSDVGNFTEAVRVLQDVLESEADKVIKLPREPALYRPTRDAVRDMLVQWKELLEKYRAEQEPPARAALDAGEAESVLRSRFLTPSGFEAALRVSQSQMEAARFESARLVLEETLTHPDCSGAPAADAARLAAQLRTYLPREDMDALVAQLAQRAGAPADPALALPALKQPASESLRGRTPFEPFPTPAWDQLSDQPLQSVALSPQPVDERPPFSAERPSAWVFPTLAGDALYVCDDQAIAAYDAATLAQLWRTVPARINPPAKPSRNEQFGANNARTLEDISAPAFARGIVVAITGHPVNGQRGADPRIHALSADDGALLWSVNPRWADEALENGYLRGPPVIEGDTVVVGVRKSGSTRRIISLYLVGIDLASGHVRWRTLVGSAGSQWWGRTVTRPDASTLHRGVVYRGDDMGVLGAFDAATGRTLWVRQAGSAALPDATMGFNAPEETPAFEIQKPVIINDSVFFVEAAAEGRSSGGDVIEVSAATGALRARRAGKDLGDPAYLVNVQGNLACVSRSGVTFIPAAQLASARASRAPLNAGEQQADITGRAVAMGSALCVPTSVGVVMVDPAAKAAPALHALPRTGNIVIPEGHTGEGGDVAHAVVVDTTGVHTFLSWEKAKATLEARVAREPNNPGPVLTYLQLALRQGRADLAPALASAATTLVMRDPESATSARARADLFELLHATVSSSTTLLTSNQPPTSTAPSTGFAIPPFRDVPVLTILADRLVEASESPRERATALIDRATLRAYTRLHEAAIEDLQEVLADPALVAVRADELDVPGAREAADAGAVATGALAAILLSEGPGPYAPFDEEAAGALATLDTAGPSHTLATAARRYAVSVSGPSLWLAAANAARREGREGDTREFLARGVESAILSARVGGDARAAASEDTARLTGALLEFASGPVDQEPAVLLLSRLYAASPTALVGSGNSAVPIADAVASLRSALARRAGRPSIGPHFGERVQALESWRPVESLHSGRVGESTSLVPMVGRNGDRFAVFAPGIGDGRLAPLWQRDCDVTPMFIRVTPDLTILYTARTTAPVIEAISNHDGATLWTSPPLQALLDGDGAAGEPAPAPTRTADRASRINTPLDGLVRPDDILFAGSADTLVLARRDGRAVSIALRDGKVNWRKSLPMDRVFDMDCQFGMVAAIGARPNDTIREALEPVCVSMDLATGSETWTAPPAAMGEHVRWVRLLSDGGALLGAAEKVLRVSAKGAVSWSNAERPLRNTGAAWLCDGQAFILDDAYDVRRISLATGEADDRTLDDTGRLRLPFDIRATQQHLVITSEQGLAIFNGDGEVVGLDAIDTPGALSTPLLCDNALVSLQVFPGDELPMRSATVEARVLVFSYPDGRLIGQRRISLFDEPEAIYAADGKLLIDQGFFTSVVDLRP